MFPKKSKWFSRKRSVAEDSPQPKQVIINQPSSKWAASPPPEKRSRPSLLEDPPCPCYKPFSLQLDPLDPYISIAYVTQWKGYCTNPIHRALAPAFPSLTFSDNYRGILHDVIQVTDVPGVNWGYADKTWAWQVPLYGPLLNVFGRMKLTPPPINQRFLPEFLHSLMLSKIERKYTITLGPRVARSILAEILNAGEPKQANQLSTIMETGEDAENSSENEEEPFWEPNN